MTKIYHAIPTHLFTGFLGVGKTSLIKRLLVEKPASERWAVLVNEFGEVGIDGMLLKTEDIAVTEVAGGCMCCSVGVPSRAALNKLIRNHNPDRIIIEPTGLANPRQVLDMFSGQEYASVLEIKAVICLVDPWCFSEPKFLQLPDFHQQLHSADIVAATKLDLATPEQLQQFYDYGKSQLLPTTLVTALPAKLPWEWLTMPRISSLQVVPEIEHGNHPATRRHANEHNPTDHNHVAAHHESGRLEELVLAADGSLRKENQAEFGYSCGWIFDSRWRFSRAKLENFLQSLSVPRIKGVLQTQMGWYSFNRMRDTLSVVPYNEEVQQDSRIEMIALEQQDWQKIDNALRKCIA